MSHHPPTAAEEWTARVARSVIEGIGAAEDAPSGGVDPAADGGTTPAAGADRSAREAALIDLAAPAEPQLELKQARLGLEMRRERREVQRLRDESAELAARADELESFLDRVARYSTAAR